MKDIATIGIDIAKNVFQLHGVDRHGKTSLIKTVTRAKFLETLANLPPCLIGGHHQKPALRTKNNLKNQNSGYFPAVMMPNWVFMAIFP